MDEVFIPITMGTDSARFTTKLVAQTRLDLGALSEGDVVMRRLCGPVSSFATNNKYAASKLDEIVQRCLPAHQGLAVKAVPEQSRILCRPKGSSNTSPTGQGKECQGYNWL